MHVDQTFAGVTPVSLQSRMADSGLRYSVCTLVTDDAQYQRLLRSFAAHGFSAENAEFIHIDNTQANSYDAYGAINAFLQVARGEHVVICHQDIELIGDGIERLDAVIADVTQRDPRWAVLGNSGGRADGLLALRISDKWGDDQNIGGPFPARVCSVDENFIIVRRAANLAVSGDLAGFHLYGAEIVLVAERLGHHAYVVDFHLRHWGEGAMGAGFYAARAQLERKMRDASRTRLITTPCTRFLSSSSRWLHLLYATRLSALALRVYFKILRMRQPR